MKVAIIDYGSGNLHSAAKAFERAARDHAIPADIAVTNDPKILRAAEKIVLPGVGAFRDCREGLLSIPGMGEALDDSVRQQGKPFLGICVGMQLLADRGLEHGETPGLGWIGGEVAPIAPKDPALKIPHMGWNNLDLRQDHPVLHNLGATLDAYFVHSFHFLPRDPKNLIASVDYGGDLTAAIGRDNILGVQFHPEKSQALGLRLIANFLRWRP